MLHHNISVVQHLLRQTGVFITWLPVFLFIHDHLASIGMVQGESMKPTLNPDINGSWHDWVFLKRWGLVRSDGSLDIKRGQVVMMKSPVDPETYLAKRVLALEGDYVQTRTRAAYCVKIPKGYVWVEGDEGFRSRDSNTYGVVPTALISAKITHIIWPWWRIGRIELGSGRHQRVYTMDNVNNE
ncbi:hypothetical protein T552_00708 [Pneumocystis carinii B80]|uniref:Mitochondrial inner membrane protease subunit 2 n=1 Tax=Pneumocystis carinii (strain B80) TaxID=1408658 RepID=A0A0W4ZPF2_PNEC8|nr:hypothetical protein T552_00708 [Pneumocystis carinii B80]KTW30230.1 hypothetical protein T552_00708 [Pneumocystis carinii B80]